MNAAENKTAVEKVEADLYAAALEARMVISGDRRVSEKDAAKLLGYAPGSLKNTRQEGRAPSHYTRGVGGGRISYRLSDIAESIEKSRRVT
ncbi:hypothetical protein [Variovorax sp. LG9.2]|uniref:hypothetical protein n=1 Tax=Variovorax sp. LG9.2 TaxID=3048626 RepID=UPI002B22BBDF|nr:hypothetical protein [Variovorax sp. LG9.2]MEB0058807.1 hypothetical protein [Variovorax sp. LG9.2]